MSGGSWPWEAPSIVFYDVWSLQEVQILTAWWDRVGPLKETLDSGESEGSVSGGSKRSRFYGLERPGGSA